MRVKTGVVRRRSHKEILKANKGYRMSKKTLYKVSHEAYMHAGQYSSNDRKKRGGQMRTIWIKRLTAAAHQAGISYSKLIAGLKKANIQLDRKALSQLAVNNPEVFSQIVKSF